MMINPGGTQVEVLTTRAISCRYAMGMARVHFASGDYSASDEVLKRCSHDIDDVYSTTKLLYKAHLAAIQWDFRRALMFLDELTISTAAAQVESLSVTEGVLTWDLKSTITLVCNNLDSSIVAYIHEQQLRNKRSAVPQLGKE